jgi:hypothetical protein
MIFYRVIFVLILTKPILGWAIDLQPNDIVAPPPDKTYLMLSLVDTENATYYRNGSAASSTHYANPVINSQSMILRAARSYTLQDLPGITYIQLPYGTVQPAGSLANYPTTNGVGDLTLTSAIWPYANRDTRTYFALAGYLIVPIGNYSSAQPFNVSENRYKTAIQMGLQKPITGNLDGMLAIDTVWYGVNNQCSTACGSITNVPLAQKPLTTTQLGPIYKINHIFTVGASYFYVAGGATSINNNYQNNVVNTQKFLLSGLAYTDIGRFSLQYGRDMGIQNGFIQTRSLAIRYMKSF